MKDETDKKINVMATTDSLTGISNRSSFLTEAGVFFDWCKANKEDLTLLFLDIDYFKQINDQYGHAFGDEVLILFATIIKNNLRAHDLYCRYGGEEFLALFATDNPRLGPAICARIMKEIEKIHIGAYPGFKFSTSIGLVSGIPQEGHTLEDFIDKGDKALYKAKKTGRDKTVIYDETIE